MANSRALIFDLDDTLVDTYGLLITPLERKASEIIAAIEHVPLSPERILEVLLKIRRQNPRQLEVELSALAPMQARVVLDAHREVLRDFSIEDLQIADSVTSMLRSLSNEYRLILLTEGDAIVQQAKVDYLGIATLFSEVIVVDPKRGESKVDAVGRIVRMSGLSPSDIVVIGNRVDNEIAVARSFGTRSILVVSGEGSELAGNTAADIRIQQITEVPSVLKQWFP